MKTKLFAIILIFNALFFNACIKENKPQPEKNKSYEKTLIRINRYLVHKYQDIIKDYIRSKKLKMKRTGTGMWYMIYDSVPGPLPKDGDQVSIEYKLSLLNGKTCYSSDSLGIKTFTINHSAVISGLNEAVQLLPLGSKGLFIMPPYLAYGLVGDGNCVPSNAIIIYDIHLIKISPKSN